MAVEVNREKKTLPTQISGGYRKTPAHGPTYPNTTRKKGDRSDAWCLVMSGTCVLVFIAIIVAGTWGWNDTNFYDYRPRNTGRGGDVGARHDAHVPDDYQVAQDTTVTFNIITDGQSEEDTNPTTSPPTTPPPITLPQIETFGPHPYTEFAKKALYSNREMPTVLHVRVVLPDDQETALIYMVSVHARLFYSDRKLNQGPGHPLDRSAMATLSEDFTVDTSWAHLAEPYDQIHQPEKKLTAINGTSYKISFDVSQKLWSLDVDLPANLYVLAQADATVFPIFPSEQKIPSSGALISFGVTTTTV